MMSRWHEPLDDTIEAVRSYEKFEMHLPGILSPHLLLQVKRHHPFRLVQRLKNVFAYYWEIHSSFLFLSFVQKDYVCC